MATASALRTWRQLWREASDRLASSREAQWLVEEVTGTEWHDRLDVVADPVAASRLDQLVARRARGEPLQYVLGRWAFRSLELLVDPRVLIPRPETEQVVERALYELDRCAAAPATANPDAVGAGSRPVAVDLGTGSGAIALSLAVERSGIEVWATDISPPALEVAGANVAAAAARCLTAVRLAHGSWWSALPAELQGRVDLVVSNPPYVSSGEWSGLDATVTGWEPRLALDAGPTGLEDVAAVVAGAGEWLGPAGVAVVEIAPHQAEPAVDLARSAGLAAVTVVRDLAGRERMLVARRAHQPRPGDSP